MNVGLQLYLLLKVAYDELLRLTDPELVKLELDCGWAVVAGRDPVRYLNDFPARFALLHARDYIPGFRPTTELSMASLQSSEGPTPAIIGEGAVDYPSIVAAAQRAGTRECFIEREPFAEANSMIDVLERDYRGLSRLMTVPER